MIDDTAIHEMRQRIELLEARLTMQAGITEGTRVRVDRILDTTDDLLKRFEAWKQIGNEMGELVNQLQEKLEVIEGLWKAQLEVNKVMSEFMSEVRSTMAKLTTMH